MATIQRSPMSLRQSPNAHGMSRYRHSPYYGAPTPAPYERDSEETSSEDGSVGPQDFVAPRCLAKPATPQVSVAPVPVVARRPAKASASADDVVKYLSKAMTYLPLADIESARAAGPVYEAAASRVAPKPLPCKQLVFLRWEPQTLRTTLSEPKPVKRPHPVQPAIFPWRCLACGTVTAGPRQCGSCGAALATSACRVFLGQLRKDLSAELATAMIRSLAPSVNLLHVESHTNGVDGRGKGCAWAYVNSVEDALRITAMHKRVFIDLDANGDEGFWYAQDAGLVPHLGTLADVVGATRGRPLRMPRQPLVAELPSKSLLAQYVATLPRTTAL